MFVLSTIPCLLLRSVFSLPSSLRDARRRYSFLYYPKMQQVHPRFLNWVCNRLSIFHRLNQGRACQEIFLRRHFFQTVRKPQEVFSHATILLPEIYSHAGLFRRGPGPPLHFLRGPKGRPRSGPAPQGLVYRQWRVCCLPAVIYKVEIANRWPLPSSVIKGHGRKDVIPVISSCLYPVKLSHYKDCDKVSQGTV